MNTSFYDKKQGEMRMSESLFISKIEYACHKKEELFNRSKAKYAIRSMFAGAFLTLSTAAGVIVADLMNGFASGTGRFVFPFIFAWISSFFIEQ